MSTSLYWLPPPSEVKENSVGWIKHEVAKHLSEDWNGLSEDFGLVGPEIIPFLQGIKAVGSKEQASDAQGLIAAIHGRDTSSNNVEHLLRVCFLHYRTSIGINGFL